MGGYRKFWERLLEAAVRRIEYELAKKCNNRRSSSDDERRGSKPRWGE